MDYFCLSPINVSYLGLFIVILYFIKWYSRPSKFPPGPYGIPIVGYIPFIGSRAETKAYQLSKKYGPIMSIRLGSKDHIFLNDFNSIQKVLVKNGDKTSGRRPLVVVSEINQNEGILLLDFGNTWKNQRKFGHQALRGFSVGKEYIEKACIDELSFLIGNIRKQNKAFDITDTIRNAVKNNIVKIIFGKKENCNDQQLFLVLKSLCNNSMINLCNKIIAVAPALRFLPPFSYYHKQFVDKVLQLFEIVRTLLDKQNSEFFKDTPSKSFIDGFILKQKSGKNPSFTTPQLVHFISDLFVAGTEATTASLMWCLLCFLHYPETLEKVRKEITEVIGREETVAMSHKAQMPYTSAFIQEVFRFRTVAPLGLPHTSNHSIEVDGLFIPQEQVIHPNIWAVHNDPNLWKNPEIFNPERFLNNEGNFLYSNHMISFSVGPRRCLGEQLAKIEIFIFLVGMVQKFDFLPDPKSKQLPEINEGILGFTFNPKPYKLVAKPFAI